VFLYACGSKNFVEITRAEFSAGLKKLGINTMKDWESWYLLDSNPIHSTSKLRSIASGENKDEFKKFHYFVFRYHMLKPGQKTLEIDAATILVQIVLGKKHPISAKFIRFLKDTGKKVLGRDQWDTLIDVFPIFEAKLKYDTDGACKISLQITFSRAHNI